MVRGADLLFDVSAAEDEGPGLGAPTLPYHMACQQLWRAIQPNDNTMLHIAPVLAPDDCPAARRHHALCERHQLLQDTVQRFVGQSMTMWGT